MTPGIFITGTNTGVGKTLVAAAWTRVLAQSGHRVVGLKPVASGSDRDASGRLRNADAVALQQAASVPLAYEQVNPYCFEPAIAPHLAAEEARCAVDVDDLLSWYGEATSGADLAIVEGAGGWRVPLYPEGFMSDLPERLGLGIVLVVGLTLGCLNHARLTFEAIEQSGRSPFLGWIGNHFDPRFERPATNLRTLEQLLGGPPLALIPSAGTRPDITALAQHLDTSRTREAATQTIRARRPA
jgi:dethiobiotin synthetase